MVQQRQMFIYVGFFGKLVNTSMTNREGGRCVWGVNDKVWEQNCLKENQLAENHRNVRIHENKNLWRRQTYNDGRASKNLGETTFGHS